VDDSPLISRWTPEDQGEARVDGLLKAWFEHLLAEPPPPRFVELLDRLDAAGGL